MNLRRTATGLLAAATIALAAKKAKSLDAGGAVAATVVGTAVYSGLGIPGTLVMLGFFLPSAALSKYAKCSHGVNSLIDKNGPRDAGQVLANGGVAAIAAMFGGAQWARLAFAASLAAASSDTWSTEIGTTFGGEPVALLTGRRGENGISGNVSDAGLLAAVAGAAWIALIAKTAGLASFRAVTLGGIGGCLVDSLAGTTLQSLQRCTVCRKACELMVHCNQPTERLHGLKYIDNDAVNAIATASAIIFATLAKPRKQSRST